MNSTTLRRRIGLALAVLVVLAIFLMPAIANAATWYVSPWGDDASDGFAADLSESEDSDDLMDAIITLDDLYQAGDIPEDAYLERRAALKEKLRKLVN